MTDFPKTLYLRADNEQALIDALSFARGTDSEGNPAWITGTHDFALDVIGDLYNNDAVIVGGEIITPATKKTGFHINIKCTADIALLIPSELIVIPPPNTVLRKWAGE